MKSFKQYIKEDYIEEGIGKDLLKDLGKILLGKKNFHTLKRAAHGDRYKAAVKQLRQYRSDMRKAGGPEAWAKKNNLSRPGMITTASGIENMIKGWAADFAGISHKEFKAILDRKTRYEETEYVSEEGGAGEWGTDKLTNKYISDTPGQSKKKKKNEKV